VEGVVVVGAGAAIVIGLLGFGFHFRVAAGERAEEYAALVLSGLPPRAMRRSLALEQRAVTWQSLGFGALFGVALAIAVLPLEDLWNHAAMGAEAVGCVVVGFLVAVLVTGWGVRRWLGRVDLRRELRVLV
jgi:ABC-type antimicrobial peptide transport system permease subunit